MVDDNAVMVDLVDIDTNINNNKKKKETKQWHICINTRGGR